MRRYTVEMSAQAARVLDRMARREPNMYRRVSQSMDDLGADPYQGKALKGVLKRCYLYRVGNYRIIYLIQHQVLFVYVIDIGHRRDVYR